MFESGTLLELLLVSLVLFAGGAASAVIFGRDFDVSRRMAHTLALIGTLLTFAISLAGLAGRSFTLQVPAILPLAGGLALGLDRLSAFFLLIIAAGALPATLYAIGYTRHYEDKQPVMAFMLNIFIPAMMLVVLARNVLTFLVFWE